MQLPEKLPHIFDQWQKLIDSIERSDELFLGFDFDGTLAPIVQSPDLARIDSIIAAEIEKLRLHDRVNIAILSGRALSDLAKKIDLGNVILVGDHGFKIRLEDGREIAPIGDFNFSELESLANGISRSLSTLEGIEVEEKEFSISVHYRNALPGTGARLEPLLKVEIAGKPFGIYPGRMCWEINPLMSWNKGTAFLWIQNYLFKGDKHILRLYIGDDRTDEDVFSILGDGEFSILVLSGERKSSTQANYKLNSQEEVAEFINMLNQQM